MSNNDLDDLLGGIEKRPKAAKSNERKFKSALNPNDAAKLSSPKSMAGTRKRVQFFLPPEQHNYIIDCAAQEGMGVMEFRSWLVDMALQAYDGGKRPEMDEIVTRKRAKMNHSTSNR